MIHLRDLPIDAVRHAIDNGEFPESILACAENVAVIMTQDWCPDWLLMRIWLHRRARRGEPTELDIDVFLLLYNQIESFAEFLRTKEQIFGNSQIPYVRYYRDGTLIGESNVARYRSFVDRFAR